MNTAMQHLQDSLHASKYGWMAWISGLFLSWIAEVTASNVAVYLSIISFSIAIVYTSWKWYNEYQDRKKSHRNYH
jgi:hypothetical protein